MTLTEILPTLRRSIPDPLEPRHWPEHTIPTTSDVVVGGVSLMRLVEITDTPAVLTGDLPHPKPAQARAQGIGNDVTVLLFRVTLRIDTEKHKQVALTDCAFDRVTPRWSECRLIGRTSTTKSITIELIPGESGAAPWPYPIVTLPGDLHQGDLLAVPCVGAVALHEVRPRPPVKTVLARTPRILELARTS
ncbi:hypothetical protein [Microbacterium lacticum]|uniref:hypothetical protein n=1 Tax=Microbacterium lacticum TaxID=33885 RepID=UPI001F5803E6|nr:hypothetical protein [Microbacterium lacticum]